MYQVMCDDKMLHDVRDEEYVLMSPKLSLELNKTGNFDFGVLSSHPEIGNIRKLKSQITVYNDGELLYAGRPTTDEADFYNYGQVSCEGELAFLLDSVQRPNTSMERQFKFSPISTNVDIFKGIIAEHNAQIEVGKKFTIGVIDIDSEEIRNFDANYENTWDLINSNFIGKYDGYLRVRHSGDVRYLDYVKQYGKVSSQAIRFGENLLDLKRYIRAEDIVTAIIPVGKNNVTIKNANGHDGNDYIYDPAAVDLYGWIYRKVDFPDVTDPDTLLSKAREHLKTCVNLAITIELTAADLHMVDVDIDAIRLGDLVPCISEQHGLLSAPGDVSTYYLVSKYEVSLDNPANNKIILGKTISALTAQVARTSSTSNMVQAIAKSADIAVGEINQITGEVGKIKEDMDDSVDQIRKEMDEMLNKVYPVGSIYLSINPSNPSELFGGTWEPWGSGRVPVGVDASDAYFNEPEKTGGSKWLQSHTHTLGNHTHSFSGSQQHRHGPGSGSWFQCGTGTGVSDGSSELSGSTNKLFGVKYSGGSAGRPTVTAYSTVTISGTTGGNNGNTSDHNQAKGDAANLQPYITCYMWKRTK